jgi:hypothetical protein
MNIFKLMWCLLLYFVYRLSNRIFDLEIDLIEKQEALEALREEYKKKKRSLIWENKSSNLLIGIMRKKSSNQVIRVI